MLVYFKNKHGEVVEINVDPKQTMKELVQDIDDFGSIKIVRINRLHYCCQCNRDIEEILLEDIDIDSNVLNDPVSSGII